MRSAVTASRELCRPFLTDTITTTRAVCNSATLNGHRMSFMVGRFHFFVAKFLLKHRREPPGHGSGIAARIKHDRDTVGRHTGAGCASTGAVQKRPDSTATASTRRFIDSSYTGKKERPLPPLSDPAL